MIALSADLASSTGRDLKPGKCGPKPIGEKR
jgi:hypothetical protein